MSRFPECQVTILLKLDRKHGERIESVALGVLSRDNIGEAVEALGRNTRGRPGDISN